MIMIRPLAPVMLALAVAASVSSAPALAIGVKSTNPADLPAGRYILDKTHASTTARISHMGFSHYTLRFNRMEASFVYDPKVPASSRIEVTVDAASIDTGADDFSRRFNTELAGDSWFDAAKYPKITFTSTSVDLGDGRRGKVAGDLTLRGVTRPVVLDVVFNGVGSGLIPGTVRTGFSASTTIQRSDYGISRFKAWVGDEVTLQIEAEFTRK